MESRRSLCIALVVLLSIASAEEPPGDPNRGLKLLHITDVHLDLEYKHMAEGECSEPPCCRGGGIPTPQRPARHYGEYNCDTPKALLQSALDAARSLKPDFVVWTGDSGPHGEDVGRADVLNAIGNVTALLRELLPGTPVFPVLGNYDFVPAGTFPPRDQMGWLFDSVVPLWSKWLGPVASKQLGRDGYYELLLTPALRLVGLNTELCHMRNFYAFINNTETAQQLTWLEGILRNARAAHERVLIIGHIPPGLVSGCWSEHGDEYERVLSTYPEVVVGQLFGHQHSGSFRLMHTPGAAAGDEEVPPFGVAYVTPALTPYLGQNPSFRTYQLEPTAGLYPWSITNFEQYYLDMDKGGEVAPGGQLMWQQGFGGLRSLGLDDLSPASWWRVGRHVSTNATYGEAYRTLEANGRAPMEDKRAQQDYPCSVNHVNGPAFMGCAKKSEETLVKQYTGSSHTYVLTAMFPFEVALSHFCPALRGVHPSDCQRVNHELREEA